MNAQSHIFISYSREDAGLMERVRDALVRSGLNLWTDAGIKEGTPNWQLAIEAAIENAAGLVCVLTPAAKRSSWVREELAYATFHDKPVYLVHALGDYRQVAILGFAVAQLVDVRDPRLFAPRLEQLGRQLHAALRQRAAPEVTHNFDRGRDLGAIADADATESRSQTEEIVRRFLPLAVPPAECHLLTVVKSAETPLKPAYRLDHTVVTLGRDSACGICLVEASISREHCQLILTNEGFLLRDLASTNGTSVNGARIRVRTLRDGDELRVGLTCTLRYTIAPTADARPEDAGPRDRVSPPAVG